MITNEKEILSLFGLEVVGESIRVSLRNGSTLTLNPQLDENGRIEYEKEYLTGKENKKIEKIQRKIKELEEQVSEIKVNGVGENTEEVQEDIDETNLEEN